MTGAVVATRTLMPFKVGMTDAELANTPDTLYFSYTIIWKPPPGITSLGTITDFYVKSATSGSDIFALFTVDNGTGLVRDITPNLTLANDPTAQLFHLTTPLAFGPNDWLGYWANGSNAWPSNKSSGLTTVDMWRSPSLGSTQVKPSIGSDIFASWVTSHGSTSAQPFIQALGLV